MTPAEISAIDAAHVWHPYSPIGAGAVPPLVAVGAATDPGEQTALLNILTIPFAILWLGLVIPNLAVTIRRLHDQDKSGWWLLINFIPFGGLVLLVFMFIDGTPGENEYGPSPKDTFTADTFA